MSKIIRTGTANGTSKTQTYSFEYDDFGNVTKVMVGNLILVQYEYAPNNGNLIKTIYGDGEHTGCEQENCEQEDCQYDNDTVIENVYDMLDRIVQIKYNGNIRYNYAYNGNGDLAYVEDADNQTKYSFEYDSLGRLCTSYTTVNNAVRVVSDYTYDGKSRVTEYACGMAMPGTNFVNLGHAYGYVYNDENGTMSSMTVTANGTVDTMTYAYDALQRLASQTIKKSENIILAKEYSYKNLSGGRTTQQISGFTVRAGDTVLDSYSYTYDSLGNITAINRNGSSISYGYDAQNQLTSMSEGNIWYVYTYDTYGNILSVQKYDVEDEPILLLTDTYSYNDPQWIDRLTAFNEHAITYDEIGNPLTYYNGSSYTFTWNGRELATATKGSTSLSYNYGADGLRTQKTVGDTVYNYYYSDGLLIRQTWGSNYMDFLYMDFLYDESGSAYSFIYNGTQYYYVKNLQGDVMRIVDATGAVVANYTYDAWGKVTNSGNIIGLYNPIRYRGYYYDTDTGFYYLQSRYYDPAIKRFISADGAISSVGGELLGYNQYAYCFNNPVNRADVNGNWSSWATAGVLIGATLCIAAVTVLTCGVGTATLAGAVAVGAAKGALIGAAAGATIGAGIGYVTTDTLEGAIEGAAIGFGAGAIVGAIAGGVAGASSFSAQSVNVDPKIQEALKILDQSGIKPGQTQVSQSGIMAKYNSYNHLQASSSYTKINGQLYVTEGHHTTIANVMKYGRLNTGINMGTLVSDPTVVTNMLWSTLKIIP